MPDIFDRLLLLKQSPVFSMVSTDDLRVVAQSLEKQEYFAGDHIFEINEQGDHLYILVSGKVGISIDKDPCSENYIALLGQGDTFGEMNLLDDLPRSATAMASGASSFLVLKKQGFDVILDGYPKIGIKIFKELSRLLSLNLRKTSSRLADYMLPIT
jgi:CRP/FNR family cyclic AMP-dependent transcriptional regulator